MLNELEITYKKTESLKLVSLQKVNYFTGINGSGKSSVLEAIYYLLQSLSGELKFTRELDQNHFDKITQNNGFINDNLSNFLSYNTISNRIKTISGEINVCDQKKSITIQNTGSGFYTINDSKNQLLYENLSLDYQNKELIFTEKYNYSFLVNDLEPYKNNIKEGVSYFGDMSQNPGNTGKITLFSYAQFYLLDISKYGYDMNVSNFFIKIINKYKITKIPIKSIIYKIKSFAQESNNGFEIIYNNNTKGFLREEAGGVIHIFKLVYVLISRISFMDQEDGQILKGKKIFAIEEPEYGLHPSLHKVLPDIFSMLNKKFDCQFFITTHSPFIVSSAINTRYQKIYHLQDGRLASTLDKYSINSDLGLSATDISFSKGIIWVEGPSDVILFRMWIQKYCLEQKLNLSEGFDYTIQALSPHNWNYVELNQSLIHRAIKLMNLHKNHIFIFDSDTDFPIENTWRSDNILSFDSVNIISNKIHNLFHPKLNLINTINNANGLSLDVTGIDKNGYMHYWVTQGTVENYMFNSQLCKDFLNQNKSYNIEMNKSLKYALLSKGKKPLFANEISEYLKKSKLKFENCYNVDSNLATKIKQCVETINSWK
jgi:AAA15 family ATPase/GTPase